jgi:peptidoglycan/LPS O-acetylase OafA/YrhL
MPKLARNVADNGYMAVGLFFVLSGFVLVYNYAGRAVPPLRFWAARYARIFPVYLTAWLLIAPAVVTRNLDAQGKLAAAGLAAAGLVQAWAPGLALAWNGPGWSLSNEAFFYLLFPVLLPTLTRAGQRAAWMVAAVSCLAALLPPIFFTAETAAYFPLFRLPDFVLGAAAGFLFLNRPRVAGWVLPVISAALAVYAAFSNDWIPAGLRGALATPLFAIFVYALAAADGIWRRWLSSALLLRLGAVSFSIYILQSPLMAYWLLATQGAAGGTRLPMTWPSFGAYTGVLIAASLACNRWLEEPARRWLLSLPARVRYHRTEAVCSPG